MQMQGRWERCPWRRGRVETVCKAAWKEYGDDKAVNRGWKKRATEIVPLPPPCAVHSPHTHSSKHATLSTTTTAPTPATPRHAGDPSLRTTGVLVRSALTNKVRAWVAVVKAALVFFLTGRPSLGGSRSGGGGGGEGISTTSMCVV